jgi:hypothetical protein
MRKILTVFLIVFLLFSCFAGLWIPSTNANPDWLSGWSYRTSCIITHATGAGTNYQIFVNIYRGTGTNSGNKVYLNNHNASTFPNDLNFTNSGGTTPLDYWIQSYNTTWAGVWTEVADNLTSVDQTIYMYYGKSGVTSTSNGANTFIQYHGDATATFLDTAISLGTNIRFKAYAKVTS